MIVGSYYARDSAGARGGISTTMREGNKIADAVAWKGREGNFDIMYLDTPLIGVRDILYVDIIGCIMARKFTLRDHNAA